MQTPPRTLRAVLAFALLVGGLAVQSRAQAIYERYRFQIVAGVPNLEHGSTDGDASRARFYEPQGIAVNASGSVYVADTINHTIRKISTGGQVTTLAGAPRAAGKVNGIGGAARFNGPMGIAVDKTGNLYVADSDNNSVRKVTPAGKVTTFSTGPGAALGKQGYSPSPYFYSPQGVAVGRNGLIYVADTGHNTIWQITPVGQVSRLAGLDRSREFSYDGTGTGADASFGSPRAIAAAPNGDLYVADRTGFIRKVTPDGVVTTIAGTDAYTNFTYPDGPGPNAKFEQPGGIAVNQDGIVYVSDYLTNRIRKITPSNFVTTLGGAADNDFASGGGGYGVGAYANLPRPTGLAVGRAGKLYIAVTSANSISATEPPAVAQALNISTRGRVEPGENVLIGGFVSRNDPSKKVLIRAIGPSLSKSGIAALRDPVLELHDATGMIVATNDNWKISQQSQIEATGAAPQDAREAALIFRVEPSRPYTAIVRGKGADAGIALVEVYDLESTSGSVLVNMSTRGHVGVNAGVMIGGFILGPAGTGATPIVVRALGPSLASAGVQNPLPDPLLELRNAQGTLVTGNDDWQQTAESLYYLQPRDERANQQLVSVCAAAHTPPLSAERATLPALLSSKSTASSKGRPRRHQS